MQYAVVFRLLLWLFVFTTTTFSKFIIMEIERLPNLLFQRFSLRTFGAVAKMFLWFSLRKMFISYPDGRSGPSIVSWLWINLWFLFENRSSKRSKLKTMTNNIKFVIFRRNEKCFGELCIFEGASARSCSLSVCACVCRVQREMKLFRKTAYRTTIVRYR